MATEPDFVAGRLNQAADDLNQVIHDIRGYIVHLRPAAYRADTLSNALRDLAEEIRVNSLIDVVVDIDAIDAPLPDAMAEHLFHIAQEALANVTKHSRATRAWIQLHEQGGKLALTVRDDGRGFDATSPVGIGHRGLGNVSDRARAVGATLRLTSAPGSGTTISVRVPVTGSGRVPDVIRVMVADDHEVVREGLRVVVGRRPDMSIVAEARTVAEAVDEAARSAPDVVVMDVRLGGGSGVDACRAIHEHSPDTRIIMLTPYADDDTVIESILAGASAFILQRTSGDALLDAIESVAGGGSLLDPDVTARLLERLRAEGSPRPGNTSPLSVQERRVLALIAEGKTNKEIAAAIGLSEKTVKNYVSSVLNKLRMHRRSEAAAFVARQAPHHP